MDSALQMDSALSTIRENEIDEVLEVDKAKEIGSGADHSLDKSVVSAFANQNNEPKEEEKESRPPEKFRGINVETRKAMDTYSTTSSIKRKLKIKPFAMLH